MEAHSHISPIHGLAVLAFVVAALGTLHLLALSKDTRPGRALLALGF